MVKRQPKFDEVLDGVRVRVYATRQGFEVIFNDDDYEDQDIDCMCYPKVGTARTWASQARLDYNSLQK